MIEVELPDGTVAEVDTDDPNVAVAAGRRYMGLQMSTQQPAPAAQPASVAPPQVPIAGVNQPDLQSTDPGYPTQSAPMPQARGPMESLALGGQNVAAGLGNIAGAPVDLATLLINGVTSLAEKGANLIPGADVNLPRVEKPFGGSQQIRETASGLAQDIGYPIVEEKDMSPQERYAGATQRVATEGLAGGGITSRIANAGKAIPKPNALLDPYRQNPGRALTTDTAAGAGAGTATEVGKDAGLDDPVSQTMLSLLGGFGGAGAAQIARAPKAAADTAANYVLKDKSITPDPTTGQQPSRRVADEARRQMQGVAIDPQTAAQNIDEGAQTYARANMTPPTSGLMSNDEGLIALENQRRTDNSPAFTRRDREVAQGASDKMNALQPKGPVDERAAQRFVETDIQGRRDAAQGKVGAAREDLTAARDETASRLNRVEGQRQQQDADAMANVAGARQRLDQSQQAERDTAARAAEPPASQGNASQRLDKAVVEDTLKPMQAEQNKRYAAIDPEGQVQRDVTPLVDAVKELRRGVPDGIPASEVLPETWLREIETLAAKEVDTGLFDLKGNPIKRQEGGSISFKDLNEMRPFLSKAISGAQSRGDYARADALRTLKRHIDGEADRLAAEGNEAGLRAKEATEFTRNEMGPVFGEGEGGRLRKDINRDDLARSETPPTETAGRFLKTGAGSQEVAADLRRILDRSASKADGEKAARDYITADLAKVAGKNGIEPARLRAWIANREGVFQSFPAVREEAQQMLRDVVSQRNATTSLQRDLERAIANRRSTSADMQRRIEAIRSDSKLNEKQKAEQVAAAEREAADVEREIRNSSLSLLVDSDPVVAVKRVFASNDPSKAMAEITAKVKGDPEAAKAWKKSIADYLEQTVTKTNTASTAEGARNVSLAEMENLFTKHEKALVAAGYSPDDMNALRMMHRATSDLAKRGLRATTGSATAENLAGFMRNSEIGLKLLYGGLRGGNLFRNMKLAMANIESLNTNKKAAELIQRAMFEPELAKHLLTAAPAEKALTDRNKWLNKLIALQQANEADQQED